MPSSCFLFLNHQDARPRRRRRRRGRCNRGGPFRRTVALSSRLPPGGSGGKIVKKDCLLRDFGTSWFQPFALQLFSPGTAGRQSGIAFPPLGPPVASPALSSSPAKPVPGTAAILAALRSPPGSAERLLGITFPVFCSSRALAPDPAGRPVIHSSPARYHNPLPADVNQQIP